MNLFNVKLGTLILDTRDLKAGDIAAKRQSCTFRGVDMELLLGEDYDAGDLFNLVLVSAEAALESSPPNGTTGSETLVPEVRLSGPNFVDNDYRASQLTAESAMCVLDLTSITTAPYIRTFPAGFSWTLYRDSVSKFDFHLRLVDPLTGNTVSPEGTRTYPHYKLVFKIYRI